MIVCNAAIHWFLHLLDNHIFNSNEATAKPGNLISTGLAVIIFLTKATSFVPNLTAKEVFLDS